MLAHIVKWALVLVVFLSASMFVFLQQRIEANTYYQQVKEGYLLESIFPVDDIQSIIVTNYYTTRTHTLTQDELTVLKRQLKEAKYAGGLLLKPGHIEISFHLKTTTKARSGTIYAYKGNVNFDGATDREGNQFNGTYFLPLDVNFDNY